MPHFRSALVILLLLIQPAAGRDDDDVEHSSWLGETSASLEENGYRVGRSICNDDPEQFWVCFFVFELPDDGFRILLLIGPQGEDGEKSQLSRENWPKIKFDTTSVPMPELAPSFEWAHDVNKVDDNGASIELVRLIKVPGLLEETGWNGTKSIYDLIVTSKTMSVGLELEDGTPVPLEFNLGGLKEIMFALHPRTLNP